MRAPRFTRSLGASGTCGSSLTWVRDLDRDTARQAIVAGLGHFADLTECRLIAEGIETQDEAATLRRLGLHLGQGYLFGRPAPISELV